jgi:transposase InsO family protein
MIHAFIDQHSNEFPIEQCCRSLKVSRSAFLRWRQRQANRTAKLDDDTDPAEVIAEIHDQSHGTYGARRVTAELRSGLGRWVNRKRVQRLMRLHGLHGVTRRRRSKGCTRSRAGDPRSDDLVERRFRPQRADR